MADSVNHLSQGARFGVFVANVAFAWTVFFLATGTIVPSGSGASVWFLAITAYWLLKLVSAPYFLPPRDVLAMSVGTILLVAPIDFHGVGSIKWYLQWIAGLTVALSVVVAVSAAIAASKQGTTLGQVFYRLSAMLGKAEILLTPAVIVSAVGFYEGAGHWPVVIMAIWLVAIVMRPIEQLVEIAAWFRVTKFRERKSDRIGTLLRVDDPDIVRVALVRGAHNWTAGNVHVSTLPNGKATYILPLFVQIQNEELVGTGLCCDTGEPPEERVEIGVVEQIKTAGLGAQLISSLSGDQNAEQVTGIVVEGSSIGAIKFLVVRGVPLEEGMVVYALVRGKKVYYQILDADTREETFQRQPFGVHVASAAQLGTYDDVRGFQKFPWLPEMNRPLFAISSSGTAQSTIAKGEFSVGSVPNTPFSVTVRLNDLIEYHTAVLGVTGTGKTELTLDIIREAFNAGCKVFCVDLTGEYQTRLKSSSPLEIGLSVKQGSTLSDLLFAVESGEFGAAKEKGSLKKFLDALKPEVGKDVAAFLESPDNNLGILELNEITNTKATLRTTELYLSSIMDWARKHRKARRVLIVLEEAHTIVPETYGAGFDHDTQWVVGRIGQIALQGRKYGVGLLLVSQRTALVSKTILSQCNTMFTHALMDRTSLDFLSSVYGPEHVRALPNLRFLDFLAYGKAVKSERTILARRPFDPKKLEDDHALDVALSDSNRP